MNASQLLALARPNTNTIRSQVNQQTNSNSSEFSQMLNGALNLTTGSNEVIENQLNSMDSQDIEKLLESFGDLFDVLPMNEGFFDPQLLNQPEVLALLNQLPIQMQQNLMNFVKKGKAFEQVLSETKAGSKEQLALLLLTSLQLDKKGQFPEQMKQMDFMKLLQQQINDTFKVQIQDQPTNAGMLLATKLIQILEKKPLNQQNTTDSGQPLTQMKSELRQIIQRVLYSADNNNGSSTGDKEGKNGVDLPPVTQGTAGQGQINESLFDQIVSSSLKEDGSVNRIQQYVLNVQKPNGSPLPEDQILNQLKNIMKQSKFSTSANGGTSQLTIKLNPEHLGSLTVKLSESNGEMVARIIASSTAAKEAIETNLQALRHVFTTQNINVEKFEIQYQGDQQYGDANKENKGQQNEENGKQQSDKDQESNSDIESRLDSFKDELLNLIV